MVVGSTDGDFEGATDGSSEGSLDGVFDGDKDGSFDGARVGGAGKKIKVMFVIEDGLGT